MKGITILGATGSIGISTLDVVERHPDRFRIVALTANAQVDRLFSLCAKYKPAYAVMADNELAKELKSRLENEGLSIKVLSGVEGLEEVAGLPEVDYVMAAIVGAAGLRPTLAAAKTGKRVLLANKEALVMSGRLFMKEIKVNNAELLPIDSEHNAVFQCMPAGSPNSSSRHGVQRILLTASGGPFRNTSIKELSAVTPEQACAHPNWSMGRKISVDSATMMNKGLEVIEARWLFDTHVDSIDVVIHPQSIIHSMVQYNDGSVLAQLGNPDMRTPIAHALAWPERIESGVEPLDMFAVQRLDFEKPDLEHFPCLKLAMNAANEGGTAPAVLNAANEVAVEAFLQGKLPFTSIPVVVEETLSNADFFEPESLESIIEVDSHARKEAKTLLKNLSRLVV